MKKTGSVTEIPLLWVGLFAKEFLYLGGLLKP